MTTPDEPTTPAPAPPTGPRGSEGLTTRPPVNVTPSPAAPAPDPESEPASGEGEGLPTDAAATEPAVFEPAVFEPAVFEPAVSEPAAPESSDDTGDLVPTRPEESPGDPDPLAADAASAEDPVPVSPDPVVAFDDPLPTATPDQDAAPEGDLDVGGVPPPSPGRSRAWLPLTAVGLAVALLAGGTAALAWELRQQDRADAAAVDAVAAARDAARLLFSYDHKTLQADFDKGLAVTTGDFRSQYQRTTKDVVTPVAVQYKAVVKAEVVEAAVIDAQADAVTALVFLNQATTSTRVQGQQVDQSRVRMRLVPRGGRWLVEEVTAL